MRGGQRNRSAEGVVGGEARVSVSFQSRSERGFERDGVKWGRRVRRQSDMVGIHRAPVHGLPVLRSIRQTAGDAQGVAFEIFKLRGCQPGLIKVEAGFAAQ